MTGRIQYFGLYVYLSRRYPGDTSLSWQPYCVSAAAADFEYRISRVGCTQHHCVLAHLNLLQECIFNRNDNYIISLLLSLLSRDQKSRFRRRRRPSRLYVSTERNMPPLYCNIIFFPPRFLNVYHFFFKPLDHNCGYRDLRGVPDEIISAP